MSFLQVDVLQGDSVFDMVESADVALVRSSLDTENDPSSGDFKPFKHKWKRFKQRFSSFSFSCTVSLKSVLGVLV